MMRIYPFTYSLLLLAMLISIGCSIHRTAEPPISTEGFSDAINHWYNKTNRRVAPLYELNDTQAIADNILLYQRSNGGWPENVHPLRVLTPEEEIQVRANKAKVDPSFDNRNIYPQIRYLSHAYQRTGDERYKRAALNGLRYTLDVQYDNGGWPHSPARADRPYGNHITFADEVMPGVLTFLRQVAKAEPPFDYVPEPLRERATQAVIKGDALVLDLQIRIDGERTIWAGQYHSETLEPVAARSYELPALQTWESVAVVEYLMSIENPSAEVIDAVHSAARWFEANRIKGVRVEEVPIEPVRFEYHTARFDRVLVEERGAPGLWARFYDLQTSVPFFTNRDGSRVARLSEVTLERRSGYSWHGNWPESLLDTTFPAWKERLN